jgi:hypothetical protein
LDPLVFPLPPPPAAVPAAELIALLPSLPLSEPDLDKSYDTQTHTREGKQKQKSLAKQIANNTRERERDRDRDRERVKRENTKNRERFTAKIGTQQHKTQRGRRSKATQEEKQNERTATQLESSHAP